MYVKTINGEVDKYPYSVRDLFNDNPQTSFPAKPTKELLAEWGVFEVVMIDPPEVDHTKNVTEVLPVNTDGSWVQSWLVTDASQEEIASRTEEAKRQVRDQRNAALTASDWTQVNDSLVDKAIWAQYRQSLRDITSQVDFPFNVVWPVKPD